MAEKSINGFIFSKAGVICTTILQKIVALAERNITQARDIFDLYLLIGNKVSTDLKKVLLETENRQLKIQITKALENLSDINYQDFYAQVVTYLTTEYKKIYSSQNVWQQVANNVKQILLGNFNEVK